MKVQKKRKKEEEVAPKAKNGNKGGESKDVKKREKKVFDLPGQKRDPPEEVSSLSLSLCVCVCVCS